MNTQTPEEMKKDQFANVQTQEKTKNKDTKAGN